MLTNWVEVFPCFLIFLYGRQILPPLTIAKHSNGNFSPKICLLRTLMAHYFAITYLLYANRAGNGTPPGAPNNGYYTNTNCPLMFPGAVPPRNLKKMPSCYFASPFASSLQVQELCHMINKWTSNNFCCGTSSFRNLFTIGTLVHRKMKFNYFLELSSLKVVLTGRAIHLAWNVSMHGAFVFTNSG